MSDGTSFLHFLDPDGFEIVRQIEVWSENGPVYGLNELEWTDYFRQPADEHSSYMADEKTVERSELSYNQGVFRAAGYSTLEKMTNGIMTIWESEQTFTLNFLDVNAKYGIVSVIKSGDIYYITFFAHTQI